MRISDWSSDVCSSDLLADRDDVRLRGDVQSETDAIKFRVIDPPSSPRVPAAPNRPLLLLAVLVVGVGGGVGAAFAKSQLRTTYPTATRLERATGLPVIGAISEIVTAPRSEERRVGKGWIRPVRTRASPTP